MTLFYNLELTNIAITCHWIDDDWNLHEALLDFKHVPGSHTGRNLEDHVFNVIKEFGIQNKLFCITTDNASNNSKMMKRISKLLKNDLKINWDPKKHHVDHVWPFSRGGSHTTDNLRVIEKKKNLRKGAKLPRLRDMW